MAIGNASIDVQRCRERQPPLAFFHSAPFGAVIVSDETHAYWLEAAHALLGDASAEILAGDSEVATLLLTLTDRRQVVMKAVRAASEKRANLFFQWEALMLLSAEPDFPGPQPVSRHSLSDETQVFVFGYVPGRHPAFESDEDFRVFGATLARFHKISKRKRLSGAPNWDLHRVARHYENPLLLQLLSNQERTIVAAALDRFGPQFQAQIDEGVWTGLVHSDSHRHNVVIDGARGSLIDFGECGFGALFWDLGVAAADSAVDAPERGEVCRQNLVAGYCTVTPEAEPIVDKTLPVFEAMRSLEVITWPVSDWSPERLAEDKEEARDNIEVSVCHLEALLDLP
jgi:Ser/Thr protein kinase RdoA (MazF antagonist)